MSDALPIGAKVVEASGVFDAVYESIAVAQLQHGSHERLRRPGRIVSGRCVHDRRPLCWIDADEVPQAGLPERSPRLDYRRGVL